MYVGYSKQRQYLLIFGKINEDNGLKFKLSSRPVQNFGENGGAPYTQVHLMCGSSYSSPVYTLIHFTI